MDPERKKRIIAGILLAELESRQPTEEQARAAWTGLHVVAADLGERDDWLDVVLHDKTYAQEHGTNDEALRAIAAALPTPADAEEKR